MSKEKNETEVEQNEVCGFSCGDTVTYKECFGDTELIFVGMAKQLDYNNDCVVTHNGDACPVRYSGLKIVTP